MLKRAARFSRTALLPKKQKLYLFQLKTRSLYIAAVGSNHYMELAGFVYILYVVVVELQQFGGNGEGHLLAFAFFQVDALEAFQLFHGAGNAAHQVADIELYDFICIVVTRIGYGYGSGQLAVRIQLLGAERDVTVLEGGVAQAIAEKDTAGRCSHPGSCCGTSRTICLLSEDGRYSCGCMP